MSPKERTRAQTFKSSEASNTVSEKSFELTRRYREFSTAYAGRSDNSSEQLINVLHQLDRSASQASLRLDLLPPSHARSDASRRIDRPILGKPLLPDPDGRRDSWLERRAKMEGQAGDRADRLVNWMTVRSGKHPYLFTIAATLLSAVSATLVLVGMPLAACVVLLLAGVAEFVDAAGAKNAFDGRVGVLVDYLADRVSDLMVFGAIAVSAFGDDTPTRVLAITTLLVSFVSSYLRAEALALDLGPTRSHFGRAERIVVVIIGLGCAAIWPTWGLRVALSVTAALAVGTLVERFTTAVRSGSTVPPPFKWANDEFLPRLVRDLGDVAEEHQTAIMLVKRDPDVRAGDRWVPVGYISADTTPFPAVHKLDARPVRREDE